MWSVCVCGCEQGVIQDFEVEGGNVAKKRSTVSIPCYCKISSYGHSAIQLVAHFRGGISPSHRPWPCITPLVSVCVRDRVNTCEGWE